MSGFTVGNMVNSLTVSNYSLPVIHSIFVMLIQTKLYVFTWFLFGLKFWLEGESW